MQSHATLDATRADAIRWADRAKDAMQTLPDHPLRQMLVDLADYVVARLR